MKLAAAALALFAAAPVLAQSNTPPAQAPAAERRAAGTRELNLNLNEADLRALSRGGAELRDPQPAEQSAGGLPTLGGDAKPMERPRSLPSTSGAYPVDSERATR